MNNLNIESPNCSKLDNQLLAITIGYVYVTKLKRDYFISSLPPSSKRSKIPMPTNILMDFYRLGMGIFDLFEEGGKDEIK